MSQSLYDEVGSRTRQAWLRTSLGVIVVTLLAERSLMIADLPKALMVLTLIPSVTALGVIFVRMRSLTAHESDALLVPQGLLFVAAILAISMIAIVAVVA